MGGAAGLLVILIIAYFILAKKDVYKRQSIASGTNFLLLLFAMLFHLRIYTFYEKTIVFSNTIICNFEKNKQEIFAKIKQLIIYEK